MRLKRLICGVMVMAALGACGSMEGHRDDPKEPPRDNERPDVEDNRQFGPELKDGVWRLTGPRVCLRYDRGGVMFLTDGSGAVRIIDLDGAADVSFVHSGMHPDSTLLAPRLEINGKCVDIVEARMMGRSRETEWMRVTAADSAMYVVVIPSR